MTDGGEGSSGMIHTDEWKMKHSEMMSGDGHPMFGNSHNIETKNKISKSLTGKVRSESSKTKQSLSTVGKPKSEETKTKMKKPKSENHIAAMMKPKPVVTCPHCSKSGGSNLMTRYHFKNCKTLRNDSEMIFPYI